MQKCTSLGAAQFGEEVTLGDPCCPSLKWCFRIENVRRGLWQISRSGQRIMTCSNEHLNENSDSAFKQKKWSDGGKIRMFTNQIAIFNSYCWNTSELPETLLIVSSDGSHYYSEEENSHIVRSTPWEEMCTRTAFNTKKGGSLHLGFVAGGIPSSVVYIPWCYLEDHEGLVVAILIGDSLE